MKKQLFYLFIILTFVSCRYSKTPETFSNDKLSIQYPSYLFKTDDVFPEKKTILQLKNDYRDIFFILVDHGQKPGDNGFDIMNDSIVRQLKRNL